MRRSRFLPGFFVNFDDRPSAIRLYCRLHFETQDPILISCKPCITSVARRHEDRIGSRADETELRQTLPLDPQQQKEPLHRKFFRLERPTLLGGDQIPAGGKGSIGFRAGTFEPCDAGGKVGLD